jgi:four helix bundle protein
MAFPHEKLDVYKEARIFTRWVEVTLRPSLKGRSHILNQILRASSSIQFNIAEGANRWHQDDKKTYYQYAKGSVGECAAILDLIGDVGVIDLADPEWIAQRERLARLAAMLIALMNKVDKRETPSE